MAMLIGLLPLVTRSRQLPHQGLSLSQVVRDAGAAITVHKIKRLLEVEGRELVNQGGFDS